MTQLASKTNYCLKVNKTHTIAVTTKTLCSRDRRTPIHRNNSFCTTQLSRKAVGKMTLRQYLCVCLVVSYCCLWMSGSAQNPSPTCSGGRPLASDPGCSTVEAGGCTLLRRQDGQPEAIELRVPANKYVVYCYNCNRVLIRSHKAKKKPLNFLQNSVSDQLSVVKHL